MTEHACVPITKFKHYLNMIGICGGWFIPIEACCRDNHEVFSSFFCSFFCGAFRKYKPRYLQMMPCIKGYTTKRSSLPSAALKPGTEAHGGSWRRPRCALCCTSILAYIEVRHGTSYTNFLRCLYTNRIYLGFWNHTFFCILELFEYLWDLWLLH